MEINKIYVIINEFSLDRYLGGTEVSCSYRLSLKATLFRVDWIARLVERWTSVLAIWCHTQGPGFEARR